MVFTIQAVVAAVPQLDQDGVMAESPVVETEHGILIIRTQNGGMEKPTPAVAAAENAEAALRGESAVAAPASSS